MLKNPDTEQKWLQLIKQGNGNAQGSAHHLVSPVQHKQSTFAIISEAPFYNRRTFGALSQRGLPNKPVDIAQGCGQHAVHGSQ